MYDFIQLITGMVTSPQSTLMEAIEKKKIFSALFIYIISLLFVMSSEIIEAPGLVFLLFPVTVVFFLFLLLLSSGLSHILAEFLGGVGHARDLLTAFALCHIPLFFTAPLVLAASSGMIFLQVIAGMANFALFIWYIYLVVQSLMLVEKLSLGKALLLLCLPVILVTILVVLFVLLILIGTTFLGLSTYCHSWIGDLSL